VSSLPDESSNRTSHIPTEYLQGIVERVTYHAEDSGYTVARLKAPGERDLVTIVGRFPDIHAGQTLRLTGYWREHLKYGRQFHCTYVQETKPATLTGVEKYLGSGLIKGIGPVTARRIVAHFGLETLDIIEHACARLIEVTGIGEKRVAMIEKAWAAQQAIKEVMLFLRGHNVSIMWNIVPHATGLFATRACNVSEILPPVRLPEYTTHGQGQDERARPIPSTTCAALTVCGL
jgi:exodeoxyribonuclease V alpha subunit